MCSLAFCHIGVFSCICSSATGCRCCCLGHVGRLSTSYNVAFIFRIIVGDFSNDKVLDFDQVKSWISLEREVDRALKDRFIFNIMKVFKETMLKRLCDLNPSLRVHVKHLVEKVNGLRWLIGNQGLQILLGLFGQRLHILECVFVGDLLSCSLVRCSPTVDYQIDLFNVVLAWEHDASGHDFTKSAASWPNVYIVAVLVRAQHNLRCTVISSHHIFGQVFISLKTQVARKSKITSVKLIRIIRLTIRYKRHTNGMVTYQILRSQFSLSKILLGFKSLWIMLAEWRNLKARRT